MTSDEADAGVRPRPAKRSLFNRPAWSNPPALAPTPAAQTSTEGEEAVGLFSRSKQVFGDIVKEREERRRQKAAKALRDKAREEGERVDRRCKRQRAGEKEHQERDGSLDTVEIMSNDDTGIDDERTRGATDVDQRPSSDDPATSFSSAVIPAGLERRDGLPVEISDDERSTAKASSQPTQRQTDGRRQRPVRTSSAGARRPDDALSPDDEHDRQGADAEPSSEEPSTTPTAGRSTAEEGDVPATVLSPAPASEEPDIKVDILITSRIPNTKPLIVQRKVHQSLRQVRFAWCSHQGFDVQTMYDIFLTWRGKRLFDVTTCRSLGIGAEGNRLHHDVKEDLLNTTGAGVVVENPQIHMEAMTEKIFEQVRRAREEQPPGGGLYDVPNLNDPTSSKNDDDDEMETRDDEKEEQIRIILKSKGREDFKLIVKPLVGHHPPAREVIIILPLVRDHGLIKSTKISRIQSAFRQARGVDKALQVFLMFDGEKLPPDQTVVDTEIGDLDHIDVHVKS